MSLQLPDLNPKRLAGEGGLDSWYPYYAGFSLSFASTTLREVVPDGRALVADPWVGSGTTTCAAARLGCRSFGADLNPFAIILARAKLLPRRRIRPLAKKAIKISELKDDGSASADDPLNEWLSNSVAIRARTLVNTINDLHGRASCADASVDQAFLLLCLVRAAREVAAIARRTNPTWRTPGVKSKATNRDLEERFEHWVTLLSQELLLSGTQQADCDLQVADARQLPLADECVDVVLSSPPYCTRIDYAVATKFELAIVGQTVQQFQELRRALMGTTTIRQPHILVPRDNWPLSIQTLLTKVRQHPSHRSEGYYFRNLLQYFYDADDSLQEIKRVLKRCGTAYLVLQSSYYKEIQIDLPNLIADLAGTHGLSGSVVFRMPVRRVLTTLNSRSRRYLNNRNYAEVVLRLQRR